MNNSDNSQQQDGYSSLGEGFYNRYRNYEYNSTSQKSKPTGSANSGTPSGATAVRSRTVVNGWLH